MNEKIKSVRRLRSICALCFRGSVCMTEGKFIQVGVEAVVPVPSVNPPEEK